MGRRLNLTLGSAQVRAIHTVALELQQQAPTDEDRQRWTGVAKKTYDAIAFDKRKVSLRTVVITLTTAQVRAVHAAALDHQKRASAEEEERRWSAIIRKTRNAIEYDDQTRSSASRCGEMGTGGRGEDVRK